MVYIRTYVLIFFNIDLNYLLNTNKKYFIIYFSVTCIIIMYIARTWGLTGRGGNDFLKSLL